MFKVWIFLALLVGFLNAATPTSDSLVEVEEEDLQMMTNKFGYPGVVVPEGRGASAASSAGSSTPEVAEDEDEIGYNESNKVLSQKEMKKRAIRILKLRQERIAEMRREFEENGGREEEEEELFRNYDSEWQKFEPEFYPPPPSFYPVIYSSPVCNCGPRPEEEDMENEPEMPPHFDRSFSPSSYPIPNQRRRFLTPIVEQPEMAAHQRSRRSVDNSDYEGGSSDHHALPIVQETSYHEPVVRSYQPGFKDLTHSYKLVVPKTLPTKFVIPHGYEERYGYYRPRFSLGHGAYNGYYGYSDYEDYEEDPFWYSEGEENHLLKSVNLGLRAKEHYSSTIPYLIRPLHFGTIKGADGDYKRFGKYSDFNFPNDLYAFSRKPNYYVTYSKPSHKSSY